MRMIRIKLLAGIAALALMSAERPAVAETVLRVADVLPATHYVVEYATKYWMDEVRERTDGAIDFEYYPAQQLGKAKDILSLTLSGVADVGYVVPSYVSDKMPLSAVAQLPGGFSSSCEGTHAFWQLATEGILAEEEFAANGVRVLFALVQPPYQMFTTTQPIDSTESIAGLKIRTTGGAMDITMGKLNAVAVRMAGPEILEALERGTIDGGVFPPASVLANDWQMAVGYGTVGANFGSFVLTYAMAESRWQALPEDVREVMAEVGREATFRTCKMVDADLTEAIANLRAAGVKMERLSEGEAAEIKNRIVDVSTEWATNLDQRGRPGSQVLKAFRAALSAAE